MRLKFQDYKLYLSLVVAVLAALPACNSNRDVFDVRIRVDVNHTLREIDPIWRFFGADEPNYAYMKNGRKLLHDLGAMGSKQVYFRAHNLLNTGDGSPALKWGSTNAYTEDEKGRPVYDWTITDSIFDAYLENGVRPYVEIGFMPEALSVKPEPYRHHWSPDVRNAELFTGWAYPPKDFMKWEDLVYNWTSHCVERYGKEEVEQWFWETWNEPNIPYWQGTEEEFLKLHDHAVNGVLRALPTARVGGPDAAGPGGDFTRHFIEHCLREKNFASGKTGTPLDFVSFHAKGSPVFDSGFVQMNMARQLTAIDRGFRIIASYPETKNLPIVIGESDPEGCAACQGDRLGYRNGTMYSSYTAASFVRKLDLAAKYGVKLEGALTWAFEFEDQPFFAGFRSLATNGINKPVLNVFGMFSRMKGERIGVESDHAVPLDTIVKKSVRGDPDVSAFASYAGDRLYIMAWHYHDNDVEGPAARVTFEISGLPAGDCSMTQYLVDRNHANAYTEWLGMGSPQEPDPDQYEQLEESSRLAPVVKGSRVKIRDGKASLDLVLERQAVTLLVLELR